MHALAAAEFPDAGVRLQRQLDALLRQFFQQMEKTLLPGMRQPPIEEHRRRGQDDAAISVMLHLLDGGIADAHRAVSFKAFQIGRDPFGEIVRGTMP
jgi:hypothetical protein